MTTAQGGSPAHEDSVGAAIRAHHIALASGLAERVTALIDAADGLSPQVEGARTELTRYCEAELLPHAADEEESLYAAGADLPATGLLVAAMTDEHAALRALVDEVFNARTSGALTAAAGALRSLFQTHLSKENDLLVPALADDGVDLPALVGHLHEILGPHAPASPPASAEAGGELDVRALAPAVRHERIFATFHALPPGESFVLVNDHDPKPLYYQFDAEHPDAFSWEYLEAGPQVWRVRIGRPADQPTAQGGARP